VWAERRGGRGEEGGDEGEGGFLEERMGGIGSDNGIAERQSDNVREERKID
jgi:hypothetical protein